jgi:hypothetical protein
MPHRAIGRNNVRAGQHRGGEVGDGDPVSADITALVEPELVVETEDEAALVNRAAHAMDLAARLVGRHEMLVAVLDPLDRPAEAQGGGAGQDVLGIKLAADAKPAADMAFVQMDAAGRQPEHGFEGRAIVVRHLGRAVHSQDAVAVSGTAIAPRVSSGTPLCRPTISSSSTTACAFANAASRSP